MPRRWTDALLLAAAVGALVACCVGYAHGQTPTPTAAATPPTACPDPPGPHVKRAAVLGLRQRAEQQHAAALQRERDLRLELRAVRRQVEQYRGALEALEAVDREAQP